MMFDKLMIASVPCSFLCGLAVTVFVSHLGQSDDAHTMIGHVAIATGVIASAVYNYRKMQKLSVEIKNGNGNGGKHGRQEPGPTEHDAA